MKSRWFLCLLTSVIVMLARDGALAQGRTLLVDHFNRDSSLNTKLWTSSSSFLDALAAASSSPPASFVAPQLSFSRRSGMQMTGPTQDYQTTGVQSLSTFTPPFTVLAYITDTQGTADIFEIFLASSDLTQFLTVTSNVNPTYDGTWATASNISQMWRLGEQFSPPIPPVLKTTYQVTIKVDKQGSALAIVEDLAGTVLSTASNLQPGVGPFYLVLGQRIGNAPTGSHVADWSSVIVSTP
jgi:hypothetical protein